MFAPNVPIAFLLPGSPELASVLRPGAVLPGLVLEVRGTSYVQVSGQRIPLPAESGLPPGQPVMVRVDATEKGVSLVVTPKTPQAPAPSAGTPGIPRPLQDLLSTPGLPAQPGQNPTAPFPGNAPAPQQQSPAPNTASIPAQTASPPPAPASPPAPVLAAAPPTVPPSPAAQVPGSIPQTVPGLPAATSAPPQAVLTAAPPLQQSIVPGTKPEQVTTLPQSPSGTPAQTGSASSSQPQAEPLSQPLSRALAAALATLRATQDLSLARAVLPAQLPAAERTVRLLLQLHMSKSTLPADVLEIQNWVQQAVTQGTLPQEHASWWTALTSLFRKLDAASIRRALEHEVQAQPNEARLAALLTRKNPAFTELALDRDLRTEVERLINNEPFRAALRDAGQSRQFEGAAHRVLERLDGVATQNTRSLQQPYVYLEMPVPAGEGVTHTGIHILGYGRGRKFSARNAAVALDVSTTHLGGLWVTLRLANGRCACRFLATQPETVAAIQEDAPELVAALNASGYPGARVEAVIWDGNRLAQAAALLKPAERLDVTG